MAWSDLTFGKHTGKSLPQVLFADPDYFFWAVEKAVFKGPLASEAEKLEYKATHMRIQQKGPEALVAEYILQPGAGTFAGMNIVPKSRPLHEGASKTVRMDRIDLSFPRRLKTYDKMGCAMLVKDVKAHYFGSSKAKMTRNRCERFFEKDSNFLPLGK